MTETKLYHILPFENEDIPTLIKKLEIKYGLTTVNQDRAEIFGIISGHLTKENALKLKEDKVVFGLSEDNMKSISQ